jgi:transposase
MKSSFPPPIPIPGDILTQTPKLVVEFIQALMAEREEERERLLAEIQGLRARIERLEARLNQDSSNSNKPPSSDNPFIAKKAEPSPPKNKRKRKGIRQQCLRPTEIKELFPDVCRCGCSKILGLEPYYIHQLLELPIIQLIVLHIILYRGRCAQCGRTVKALVPPSQRAGFGPNLSALIAELCGAHGDCRRGVQDFLLSVFGLPISQGGIQKVIDRVTAALKPHYEAIEAVAHAEPVNHVDETSWRRKGKLRWLWVMTNAAVSLFMVHAERSKAAFQLLIKDWAGILVSDGYGVYRKWAGLRQTCLAHLIREADGLSGQKNAQVARCGAWALKELRLLCHMAHAPPTQGEWSAFYARLSG